MEQPHVASPTPDHVRAVFADSAVLVDLSSITTFEQLAERLCRLGDRHAGPLTGVDFIPGHSVDCRHVQAALIRQLTVPEDAASTVIDDDGH